MKNLLLFLFLFLFLSASLSAQNNWSGSNNNIDNTQNTTNERVPIKISNAYPNPATEYVNFDYQLESMHSEAKITILNLLGSVVKEYKLDAFENKIQIPVHAFKSGVYFYRVSIDNQNVTTKKFIIK
ncbi:MAG: T9SS type A sorting domain-containing protein [Bernardetiaceae bacterium]|nr:T9SS type A sorting domain-containing protein [Bernardetiaceae bacterium]